MCRLILYLATSAAFEVFSFIRQHCVLLYLHAVMQNPNFRCLCVNLVRGKSGFTRLSTPRCWFSFSQIPTMFIRAASRRCCSTGVSTLLETTNNKKRAGIFHSIGSQLFLTGFGLPSAIGCADLEEVPNADIRRTDSTAVVKCRASQETWHLVCRGNTWIGDLRNCTVELTEGASDCPNMLRLHRAAKQGKRFCARHQTRFPSVCRLQTDSIPLSMWQTTNLTSAEMLSDTLSLNL